MDTGTQCNVIPLNVYRKATKDYSLQNVVVSQQKITAYGGSTIPVYGTVLLRVQHGDGHCKLVCKLVDRDDIRESLGRKACVGMKIIAYLDNDQVRKLDPRNAQVFSVDEYAPMTTGDVIKKFPTVFGTGVGLVAGEYHIRIDPMVEPVQHATHRVPVALREQLKRTLEELTQQGIIAPVTNLLLQLPDHCAEKGWKPWFVLGPSGSKQGHTV